MNKKPNILVTNDDGISSPGIKSLIEVTGKYGNLTVIAPDKPMSGVGHAITMRKPIIIEAVTHYNGISSWKCSGTPVDCVKFGLANILKEKPQLVVSGINHGSNSSISIIYSGTMGAAIEGSLHGVPSIGFSLCDYNPDADFSRAKIFVAKIFQSVIENGLTPFTCLNVNIPKEKPKGIKVCRQTHGKWVEEFDKRTDPHNREYFWLSGYFKNFEENHDETDEQALENHFVSIVPVTVDMTCYKTLELLKNWKF